MATNRWPPDGGAPTRLGDIPCSCTSVLLLTLPQSPPASIHGTRGLPLSCVSSFPAINASSSVLLAFLPSTVVVIFSTLASSIHLPIYTKAFGHRIPSIPPIPNIHQQPCATPPPSSSPPPASSPRSPAPPAPPPPPAPARAAPAATAAPSST